MSKRLVFLTKKELIDLYVNKKMFAKDIAAMIGCKTATVIDVIFNYGIKLPTQKNRVTGAKCGSYKGGKTTISGYKYITDKQHPYANSDGYITQHRQVVEAFLGYTLPKAVNIHHINGEKLDNRVENLAVFNSHSDHTRYHKHLEKHGLHSLGLITIYPGTLTFPYKIFWGGKWKRRV